MRWRERGAGRIDSIISAVLIELRRGDEGSELWLASHLGRIWEGDLGDPLRQAIFWARVGAALDAMEIDVDERKKIERKIRALVPRPSTYDS